MSNLTARLGGASSSLAFKAPCRVATTANITLSGFQTIDGVTFTSADEAAGLNMRVLVLNQTDAKQNGIYDVKSTGWIRAKDFDGTEDLRDGTRVYVAGGSTLAGAYVLTTDDPIEIDTDNITFVAQASVDINVGALTEVLVCDPDADFISYFDTSAGTSGKMKPENLFKGLGDGTASAPALAFEADQNTGLYRITDDTLGFAVGGAGELRLDGASLSPVTSDGLALGTASLMYADLFLASGSVVNFNNGDVTLTHSADALTLAGGTLVLPASGLQIGASNPFSDSAGALTLQNIDAIDTTTRETLEAALELALDSLDALTSLTVTTAGNTARFINNSDSASVQVARFEGDRATMADGDAAYLSFMLSNDAGTQTEFARETWFATDVNAGTSVDGALAWSVAVAGSLTAKLRLEGSVLSPSTTDATALGSTALMWADLFLADGGVLNWNNGNATLTHSTGLLTTNVPLTIGGVATADGFAPTSATATGNRMYLPAANTLGFAINGSGEIQLTASALSPITDGGSTLGVVTTNRWGGLHLSSGAAINWNSDVTITHASDTLAFAGASTAYTFANGPVTPSANDGVALGTATVSWADLFLASGGVINFNNGNYTLTHAAGTLTAAGGPFTAPSFIPSSSTVPSDGLYLPAANTLGFAIGSAGEVQLTSSALSPMTSDGSALGTATLMWADLFLASGAVLNFNNGDVLVTHAANTLTFTGASSGYIFDATVRPSSSGAGSSGTVTEPWSDVYIAGAGRLNFGNDVSLTHSSDKLAFTGAASGYTFDDSVIIGHTAELSTGGITTLHQQFGADAATSAMVLGCFNTTDSIAAEFQFLKSGNASIGSATVVAADEVLGKITWFGTQTTGTFSSQSPAAQIRAVVDGAVTTGGTDMPGRIVFATTADGASTLTDRLILDSVGTLKPNANDGVALGTGSLSYADLFLASGAVINFNNGDVTLTHSANALAFAGASSGYTFDAAVTPSTNDAAALGTSSLMWSDLFLASGSVINFNNGDVLVTHSANLLAFTGASSGYSFDSLLTISSANPHIVFTDTDTNADGAVSFNSATGSFSYFADINGESANSTHLWYIDDNSTIRLRLTTAAFDPGVSDSKSLGTSSVMWSDLFLADGGVVNWNNNTANITHNGSNNGLAINLDPGNAASSTSLSITLDGAGVMVVDTSVRPNTNDGTALGSATVSWADLFLASGGVINWNNGDVTVTHAANTLTFAGASSGYNFDALVTTTVAGNTARFVNSNDGASSQVARFEGDRATMADNDEAYLSFMLSNDGGTQTEFARETWIATDVNAGTSVDGALAWSVAIAGSLTAKLRLEGSALTPSASDGTALGTTTLMWADLFLASGAVINFNNGDVTLTHSADTLTVAGGTLAFGAATSTGVVDFGGATSFEIPNGTAPSLSVAGQIALDTNGVSPVTRGVVLVRDGTGDMMLWPSTNAPSSDNDVMVYDSGTNTVRWEAQSGAGGSGIANVVEDTTPQLGGDLDANTFWIGFDDATGIEDDSGNEQLVFQKTASAVNYWEMTNSATASPATQLLAAVGDDTNIHANIQSKGSGVVQANGVAVKTVGLETVWIPAGAMKPRNTNGCGVSTYDSGGTADLAILSMDFDTSTQEYAHTIPIGMPKSWNESTVTVVFYWTNTGGASTETVRWSIAGLARSDDDALDTAFGTAVTVDDTWLAQNDLHISATTGSLTIGGTPAENDQVIFEITRVVASDNMAGDARLLGIKLLFTTNAATDA